VKMQLKIGIEVQLFAWNWLYISKIEGDSIYLD
jgi:hypothetical protein